MEQILFQFLMVQLKQKNALSEARLAEEFQFLMVQLKRDTIKANKVVTEFQFLMVQLKLSYIVFIAVYFNISIPYGAIKTLTKRLIGLVH